jgi:ATP-dependent Clp protease ATP-binding subunit ClpC
MFELYTEKARRVIFFARFEASYFGKHEIEGGHLLLGLAREDRELMRVCVGNADLYQPLREQILARSPLGKTIPASANIPFSDETKRILKSTWEEAQHLRHKHIGTEHLLLSILREKGSSAAQILQEHGADYESIRKKLEAMPPPLPSAPGGSGRGKSGPHPPPESDFGEYT